MIHQMKTLISVSGCLVCMLALTSCSSMAPVNRHAEHPTQTSHRSQHLEICCQPESTSVRETTEALFTVCAKRIKHEDDEIRYQWQFLKAGQVEDKYWKNMPGETNRVLTISAATTSHVGLYRVIVDHLKSEPAFLSVYAQSLLSTTMITVYGAPIASGSSPSGCPGPYAGYVPFAKSVSNGWGWYFNTITPHSVSASTSGVKVEYVSAYGEKDCGTDRVIVSHTRTGPYRFCVYFPNASQLPTGPYAITLENFKP